MRKILLGTVSILLFFATTFRLPAAAPESATKTNLEIAATIEKLMDELSRTAETLDAEKTLAPLSKDKDAVFFLDSKPYTRSELIHYLGKLYGALKTMSIKMDRKCVKVLSPDAAVWIACGKGKSVSKSGESFEEYLTETWIWQRIEGKWQVIHYNETVASLPNAEKKGKIEKALTQFALELQKDVPTAENIYGNIEKFLSKNPEILGSSFSMNPEGGNKASFYSYRSGTGFTRHGAPTTYDYAAAEWYVKSVKTGKVEWSEPYYDIDGAGVFMVTCSIPVYSKEKKLLGVVTADLGI
jgi:hypothetical protein